LAVSCAGVGKLLSLGSSEVTLLGLTMSPSSMIDGVLKRQLLFGLLMHRGELVLVREDGEVVAPVPELSPGPSSEIKGKISFLKQLDPIRPPPRDAPTLEQVCEWKGTCQGVAAHRLIHFLLQKLADLSAEEATLSSFRLKSYSSVMNKLFYRGKALSDLFAATVQTDGHLILLKQSLTDEGATSVYENNIHNGNSELSYRYVRILQVELEGSPSFTFPVHYEIIMAKGMTPAVPHKQYQLERLRYDLNDGFENTLGVKGFTLEKLMVNPRGKRK
jgi:hypothetical protein